MSAPSPKPGTLLAVWVALMVLLALTWAAAKLNLGPWNPVSALTIAVVKMLLVVTVYMHLKYGARLIWVYAAAGLFWLLFMVTFTLGDYLTRAKF